MITRYLFFKRIRTSSVFCYLIIPFSKILIVGATFTLAFEKALGQSSSTFSILHIETLSHNHQIRMDQAAVLNVVD